MDDLVGYAFSLLINPKSLGWAGGHRLSSLKDFDIVVLEGLGQEYLSDLNVEAILIRPDRYILGTANTEKELAELLESFPLRAKIVA